jgi:hypothetical protein
MRSWSLDELIADYERMGRITSPFTADERGLALSVAQAYAWAFWQEVLPGRCSDQSEAHFALSWGVWKVCEKRGDWAPWKKRGDQHG